MSHDLTVPFTEGEASLVIALAKHEGVSPGSLVRREMMAVIGDRLTAAPAPEPYIFPASSNPEFQARVVQLVREGHTDVQIAERYGTTPRTVSLARRRAGIHYTGKPSRAERKALVERLAA